MNVSTGFVHSTGVESGIGGLDTVENQPDYMAAYGAQDTNPLPHAYNANLDSIHVYPVAPDLDVVGADENAGDCFVCEECSKQFVRHCDLNKHLRTHSRPFKCTVESCKYHGLGWPTEKELERHYNDKHEAQPQIFTCSFQPCQYTSKRESNLKQHMEKTHGWNYVRSRASRLYKDDGRPPLADMTQMATPSRHFGDFVLFPEGTAPSIPTPTSATRYGPAPDQDISDSYVPWASPPTREEVISQCLRSVASVIDPRLAPQQGHVHEGYVHYDEGGGGGPPQNLAMQPHGVGVVGVKVPPSPSVYTMEPRDWYSVPSFVDTKPHETTRPSTTGRAAGAPGSAAAGPPSAGTHSAHGTAPYSAGYTRHEEDSDEDDGEDDDGDDGEPPAKRPRMESHDSFGDDQMPCPFRLSDPAFFDRNNKEKFSPCHTKHKDISTIVRHLSRPAHKLEVDERSISSFDIEAEEGRADPQAGLCRKCWKRFRDRDEFRSHLAQPCTKVSKGKREKFELLLSTFCPGSESAAAPVQHHRHPSSAQGDAIPRFVPDAPYPGLYPPGVGGDLATPVDAPAPSVASDMGSHRHVMVKSEESPPDRQEFQALSERVNRLERENRETQALLRSFLHQVHRRGRGGRGTAPSLRPPAAGAAGRTNPLSEFPGGYPERFSDEELVGAAGDPANLLGGMNSRPTDVDREALPHEAQRTLSGLSSSSDKSSVRHVPLNARFASGTTAPHTRRLRSGGEPPRTPPPKLSTSLDSGYGGSSTKDNNNNNSGGKRSSGAAAAAAAAVAAAELGTVAEHGEGAPAPASVSMPESQPLPGQEFLREPGIDDFREAGIDGFDDVWPEGNGER